MTMASISIIVSICTVIIDSHSSATRLPRWLRFIAFTFLARLFCLSSEVPEVTEESIVKPNVSEKNALTGIKNELSPMEEDIKNILQELNVITNFMREQKVENSISEEWKLFAKIIDRLMFWLCLFICVVYFITVAATI